MTIYLPFIPIITSLEVGIEPVVQHKFHTDKRVKMKSGSTFSSLQWRTQAEALIFPTVFSIATVLNNLPTIIPGLLSISTICGCTPLYAASLTIWVFFRTRSVTGSSTTGVKPLPFVFSKSSWYFTYENKKNYIFSPKLHLTANSYSMQECICVCFMRHFYALGFAP